MGHLKKAWEHFVHNRFNHLLIVLIGLIFASPFLHVKERADFLPLASLVYTVAVLAILRTITRSDRQFYLGVAIKLTVFTLDLIIHFGFFKQFELESQVLTLLVRTGFFVLFVKTLLHELFATQRVNSDTIKGGICVYLLVGFLWALFYKVAFIFDPRAFSFIDPDNWNFIYFSFVTLTAVGFGDIFPVSSFARMLTCFEALCGQLFLAVFIARLMGLHIAHKLTSSESAHR